jgi:predicted nuclease with TOPRIM domain
MAPKKPAAPAADEEPSLADLWRLLKSQGEQLASICAKVNQMDQIETEVRNVKTIVESLREENKSLRAALKLKDEELTDVQSSLTTLEQKLNNLEQHHRGWSARVLNIPTTEEEESDPDVMIQKVYSLALKPILEGAVREGRLKVVPSAEQVLEMAHVLPGKPGYNKPIIMRFFSRNIRNLCFQLKKDFAEREQPRGASGGG